MLGCGLGGRGVLADRRVWFPAWIWLNRSPRELGTGFGGGGGPGAGGPPLIFGFGGGGGPGGPGGPGGGGPPLF